MYTNYNAENVESFHAKCDKKLHTQNTNKRSAEITTTKKGIFIFVHTIYTRRKQERDERLSARSRVINDHGR